MNKPTKYRIKDKSNGTYYRYMTAIGPCFGGSKKEAMTFDSRIEAVDATKGRNWIMVFWEIEPKNNGGI